MTWEQIWAYWQSFTFQIDDWSVFYGVLDAMWVKIWAAILSCFSIFNFICAPIQNLFDPVLADYVPEPESAIVELEGIDVSLDGWQIVYSTSDTVGATAANLLKNTLASCTGVTLAVVNDSTAPQAKEIVVGQTNREATPFDRAQLKTDGYGIRYEHGAGKLYIYGGGGRGTLYGCYYFLEHFFDCHWYTKDLIVTPAAENVLTIPVGYNRTYVPDLQYRETDWISPANAAYSMANALNGNSYRYLSPAQGGNFGYIGSFCHTYTTQFVNAYTYFDSHPEYFAWRADPTEREGDGDDMWGAYGHRIAEGTGMRIGTQLCLTNPDVLQLVVQQVKALWLSRDRSQPDKRIVSLTQQDNQAYCQCPNCAAIDEAEGSQAGTNIWFINKVSEELEKDPAMDGILLDTFAYQYTRTPPKTLHPRDNVIVRLCSIECCFAHPLNDPTCTENKKFAADIKTWASLANTLYVWDYTGAVSHYNCFFPNLQVLQANMQFFRENHVKGVYEQGNFKLSSSGGHDAEFAELRVYLMSRLMYNPDLDFDAEMNGFLKAYYGEGWQYLKEFLRMCSENAGNKKATLLDDLWLPSRWMHKLTHGTYFTTLWENIVKVFNGGSLTMSIFSDPGDGVFMTLTDNEVAYMDKLWEQAIAATQDAAKLRQVEKSRIGWRYFKSAMHYGEFADSLDPAAVLEANIQLYRDIRGHGIYRFNEWNLLQTEEPVAGEYANDWIGATG
jgi:hypothetical protein